jgi:rare lipoprotein A
MKNLFYSAQAKKLLIPLFLTIVTVSAVLGDDSGVASKLTAAKLTTPETGIASFYGQKYHGRQTANGESFNMNDLTAAHPRLAFGTRVKVTHLANNLSVTVRINDRGPFVKGRVIDLSQAAASELQMIQTGLAEVKIEVIK